MDSKWKDKKILIVEDDEITILFIEEILKNTGVEILKARTGREAINTCKEQDDIDLILMDLQLPKLSGFDATKEIKSIDPNIIIIAQTAFALKEDKQKALEAGCDDYIAKPFDYKKLNDLLDRYLRT